ncbi:hypothetical protein [Pseudonocardia nigra]|nr:hypothetical protein [Pseudonocardia nigra]
MLAGLIAALAVFLLYAMFLDQGGILAPFFGVDASKRTRAVELTEVISA